MMSKKVLRAIGLMSGTSCDGIDASLIETDGENNVKLLDNYYSKYSAKFRSKLLKVINGDLIDLYEVENELSVLHAKAVEKLLKMSNTKSSDVDVIGFHGQTIYHNPSRLITVQIGNAHLLSKLTGVDVVYDIRKNDVVNGGQGAPLIPIFHKALSAKMNFPVCFVNIGGVSNVTYIKNSKLIGFDCGTGNALINDYMMNNLKKAFDKNGALAFKGKVNESVIEKWISDKFFSMKPPKSIDRNHFRKILKDVSGLKVEDAIATLSEITVLGIVKAIRSLKPKKVYVCGGGRKNRYFTSRLVEQLDCDVNNIEILGINGDFVESYGWGYLAVRSLKGLPITFPSTTKCKRPISGGVLVRSQP